MCTMAHISTRIIGHLLGAFNVNFGEEYTRIEKTLREHRFRAVSHTAFGKTDVFYSV